MYTNFQAVSLCTRTSCRIPTASLCSRVLSDSAAAAPPALLADKPLDHAKSVPVTIASLPLATDPAVTTGHAVAFHPNGPAVAATAVTTVVSGPRSTTSQNGMIDQVTSGRAQHEPWS